MGYAILIPARTSQLPNIRQHIFPAADMPADIGAVILSHRQRVGWSQAELAERSGVPRETIARLEGGRRRPLADTVLRLFAALLLNRDDVELQDVVPTWPEADGRQIIGHGPRSRARRRQLKLTLATVARAAGVSEATLSRFERSMGPTPKLLNVEVTALGDRLPRLRSHTLALALGFRNRDDHEAFCDADDWQQWHANT